MIGKSLRKWSEIAFLNSIGKCIAKLGLTPNQVTILSIPAAIAAAYFIYIMNLPLALLFIILSIVIDNLDGAVARARKMVTKFGSYFDVMCDKYVEMIFYAGFAFAGFPIESFLAATGTMLNSYAKPAAAIRIPLGNEDWPAIGERAERLLILIIGIAAAIFMPTVGGYSTISITLILITILVHIGAFQRMAFAKKLIQKYEKTGKKQMVRK